MPASALRKALWVLAAAILALVFAIAVLPFIASTQIVRDRIAHEMSAWSGLRVGLGQAPDIEVWPAFRAVLNDVTMSAWGEASDQPMLQAERVEIGLSPLSALRGDVDFSTVKMLRPVLRLGTGGVTPGTPLPDEGRIAHAVELARAAMASDPIEPDPAALPGDRFGVIEFIDGRVVAADGVEDAHSVLSSVSGNISWPSLNGAGILKARGIWRGESVMLDLSSDQPLMLFAGGNAPVKLEVRSAPFNLSYAGIVSVAERGFVDGSATLSSPSLRRALEWSGADISPGAAIGAVTLAAEVAGSGDRFKFENARLSLAGNPGVGVLDLSFADRVPGVAGTLAFETLDLRSFLAAFTALPGAREDTSQAIDTSFTNQINLDLRLSAARATVGRVELAEVAATAQVKDGLAAFDISDATVFAGSLQAGIRLERRPAADLAEIRFHAMDIDSAAFSAAAGLGRWDPQGRSTISVVIKGPATSWDKMLDRADGTVTAQLGPGMVSGLDLPSFLQRASEGGFFALGDVAEGSLTFERADFKASITNGIAKVESAELASGPNRVSLGGVVSLAGRGLALSGTVSPTANPSAAGTSFFIGGPWSAPYVSAVLPGAPPAMR
jgi:AsmA protein